MNREIKFRAWDGTRMYHFENHEWTLDFNDTSGWNVVKNLPLEQLKGRKWDAGESSDTAEQFQLMQYTGLKDRNGKEIYEGDVVHVEMCECAGHDENGNEEWINCIGEVSHEDGMFVFDGHSAGTIPVNAYIEKMIVIGNIYQNPELLKYDSKTKS